MELAFARVFSNARVARRWVRHSMPLIHRPSGASFLVLLGMLGWGCDSRQDVRKYTSPNGEYSVELVGSFERPFSTWERQRVTASVSKRDAPSVAIGEVFYGNYLATPFEQRYTVAEWVAPNALQFFHKAPPGLPCDTLRLRNDSGESLASVIVQADDLVLGFDIKAGGQLSIPMVPSDEPALIHVKAKVQFEARKTDGIDRSATLKRTKKHGNLVEVTIFSSDIRIVSRTGESITSVVTSGTCSQSAAIR